MAIDWRPVQGFSLGIGGGVAVGGLTDTGIGVAGRGETSGWGVYGSSDRGFGVRGNSRAYVGVYGTTGGGVGVAGTGSPPAWAGAFEGEVRVSGNLTVTRGHKSFKIDHPLDPQTSTSYTTPSNPRK